MEEKENHIILVAGEASGDLHSAHLVEALKIKDPSLTFSGLGGPKMKAAGVELYEDMTKLAVIGFIEVLKHFWDIRKVFNLIRKKIRETKPKAVILVDYPGFNLHLAKKLKKQNVKVIYYISPQVWAWKKNRVTLIKKYIDKMLVIFKFEKDFYAQFGVDVEFVGHPLIDIIKVTTPKDKFLQSINLREYKTTVGILPGSREKEIQEMLPVMLDAAQILHEKYPMLQFLVSKAPTIDIALINKILDKMPFKIRIVEEDTYNAVNACDLCLVTSGTATLETAILQKPMVVIYKTSFITWVLAKMFIKIPNIGLVNVVARKKIVPECIQHQATGKIIAYELEKIFTDEIVIADIKNELSAVKEALDSGGASEKAANEVIKVLSN